MEILQHIVGVLLLAAFLYFGLKIIRKRRAERESVSGGSIPHRPRDEA